MTVRSRTDESSIAQLCEYQPEAIAWYTPVFEQDTSESVTDFEVRYCNMACAQKTGLTKEEIIGKRVLRDGFPDATIKELKFEQCVSVFRKGEPVHYSYFSSQFEKYFMLSGVKVNNGILITSRDLTDLYITNQELQRQVEEREKIAHQFEKTINASADGIVTLASVRDEHGDIVDFRITQCNEQGRRMGRLPEDAVGKKMLDLFPQMKELGYFDIHRQVVETGEPFSAELPFSHDSHTENIYIVSLKKLDDGLVSNFIDVTDNRQLQNKALENAKELDAIFQTSLTAIYLGEAIRDENGEVTDLRFLRVNKTFSTITGRSEEELLNNSLLTISPITRKTGLIEHIKKVLLTGAPLQNVLHYPHLDRWFEFSMSRMDANRITASFTDITGSKKKEAVLQNTVAALQRSNDSLEEFTRAASHDLKEPTRKILFFGSKLRDLIIDQNTEEALAVLERLEFATGRMRQLIDDLLEYSHVNIQGHKKEPIDLNKKLKLVLTDLELLIREKNAQVTAGELPTINGYRRQMQQLFQNIISNALKYSRPGVRPEIAVTAEKITGSRSGFRLPEEFANSQFYLIEIRDNGIGFDPDEAERIFNVFTRLHGNYEYDGTGIGLSIVRKVVGNHNGFIMATGEPGVGACFRILLPC